MPLRFCRIAVKRGAHAIKPERLRRERFFRRRDIRHQQHRRVLRTNFRDQRIQPLPTGARASRGIKRDEFRPDAHQFIHLFHGRRNKHFAVRIITLNDANHRQ